jgi:hypothetical protein
MVVAAVSQALRQILWEAFDADAVIRPIVVSESAIVFTNPTETARDSSNRLSLWLCSQRERLASATRNPWRYMGKISVASRSPCRPTLRAALIRHSTSAGVKYSRACRSVFFGFFGWQLCHK